MAGPLGAAEPGDEGRILVRRYRLRVLAVVGVAVLLVLLLRGNYRRELYHLTGPASWMWVGDDVSRSRPTAGLFVRTFTLADRPSRAVAKVCGDRQYVLWINSFLVSTGHNRPRFGLDVVPVTDLLREGLNVIAIEASSPTSVGAVLFSMDLEPGPEGLRSGDPRGRNAIVSGPGWTVTGQWSTQALATGLAEGHRPWIWGTPPDHPWSYPEPRLLAEPLVQSMGGEPRCIPGSAAERAGDRAWRYRLGERFHGLVWIDVAGRRPAGRWIVRTGPPGDGTGRLPIHVVPLPGARRWLLPEVASGPELVVEGPAAAPDIEIVSMLRSRTAG